MNGKFLLQRGDGARQFSPLHEDRRRGATAYPEFIFFLEKGSKRCFKSNFQPIACLFVVGFFFCIFFLIFLFYFFFGGGGCYQSPDK